MSYQFSGKVISVGSIRSGEKNGKVWKNMSFVVEESVGEYKPKIEFQYHGEKVETVDFKKDDFIDIEFKVESKPWGDKFITNAVAIKVTKRQSRRADPPAPDPLKELW